MAINQVINGSIRFRSRAELDRDWTLLTRNYLLYTRNNEDASGLAKGNTFQDRFQIGAAWRPVDHNQWNGLARYEYKKVRDDSTSKDATGVSTGEDYRTHIASAHIRTIIRAVRGG